MKRVALDGLVGILRGLLKGDLELVVIHSGKKQPGRRGRPRAGDLDAALLPKKSRPGRKPKAEKAKKPAKRGRRPLPPSLKKKKAERAKAAKARQARQALPDLRSLFQLLQGKIEGLKLSEIVRHFGVKRNLMKVLLEKCAKKGDLDTLKGRYFLARRLRPRPGEAPTRVKPQPVSASVVLGYLASHGPATLSGMAADLNEPGFHRLIRVANALKKSGQVTVEGKTYRLTADAGSDRLPTRPSSD